jgi:hypothetical protein
VSRVDVYSDLQPKQLNKIGLAVFEAWTKFAIGQRTLGGRRIRNPTGTYASSLRFEVLGKNHVAVIADEGIAPHAKILETGHRQFDMLDYLAPGKSYPITKTTFKPVPGAVTRYAINPNTGRRARTGSGLVRAGRFVPSITGIVRTPMSREALQGRYNTSGRGPAWTVPAMPAYSPSRLIAALFSRRTAQIGGVISYTR